METKIAVQIKQEIQNKFRVVLLNTKESLNIGSVARAMMNMGFSELVLVSPLDYDLDRAGTTARKAKALLETAKVVTSIEDAISDCSYVAGFSTKDSKNTPPVFDLNYWSKELDSLISVPSSKVALLFGPEDTGLRYEHLPICNSIIRIPSCDQYDSLNLAQAALIVFYTIASQDIDFKRGEVEELAIAEQFTALDEIVESIANKSQFKHQGTPDNTMRLLKNLFRRPKLTKREMQIALGFFSRIDKSLSK